MAKFATVGYGNDGNTKGYTYLVNDNVRTGDKIQPTVRHYISGKVFATTGIVQHSYKETTAKGQNAKQQAQQNGAKEITQVYSGKELGIEASRVAPKTPEGQVPPKHSTPSQYNQLTRAGNLAMRMKQDPNIEFTKNAQETFDSYSKKYMDKGE